MFKACSLFKWLVDSLRAYINPKRSYPVHKGSYLTIYPIIPYFCKSSWSTHASQIVGGTFTEMALYIIIIVICTGVYDGHQSSTIKKN